MIGKVVCVNNIELVRDFKKKSNCKKLPLTIGKIYEQDLRFKTDIKILEDDNGECKVYSQFNFVSLSVWREMQIDKII